jgi:hypothetical protein
MDRVGAISDNSAIMKGDELGDAGRPLAALDLDRHAVIDP